MLKRLPPIVLALLAACSTEPSSVLDLGTDVGFDGGTGVDGGDAGADGGDAGLDAGPTAPFSTRLNHAEDYAALEDPSAPGVKYLARVDGRDLPNPLSEDCYFQNMRRFSWHLQFLQHFEPLANLDFQTYVRMVLSDAFRKMWGGDVRLWPGVPHPIRGRAGIMSYVVYTEQNESLSVAQIAEVDARLKACIPFASDLLAFVPTGPAQQGTINAIRGELMSRGIAVVDPRSLIDGLTSQSYSLGTGFGFLRVVPEGEFLTDYGPRDIVVVASAPNDISIVSGLISRDPQNLHSHVNLRLQEKGIPNAAVPAIYDNDVIAALDRKLVKLVVSDSRVEVSPATLADAQSFWDAQRPVVPEPVSDLEEAALGGFSTIDASSAPAYGAKAANLAELYDLLPDPHRTPGFAVPFSKYVDHIEANDLGPAIDDLLADPMVHDNAAVRSDRLKTLRRQIRDAPLSAALLSDLQQEMVRVFGAQDAMNHKIRFRSSTNVEDLDALTGAGLYDSRSGCLADDLDSDAAGPSHCLEPALEQFMLDRRTALQAELAMYPERLWLQAIIDDITGDLTEEKTVERAIKRVWSSLWNLRAFDEREYYGIDHRKAFMGVSVNRSFVLERVNAVALTNLPVTSGAPLFRVISQVGYESVVRPDDPTAVAEVLTFRRDGGALADVDRLLPSSLSPNGDWLWSDADLNTLAALLFQVQDHFATNVYPELDPLRLDVEIKVDRDGNIVLKQARPYVTREP